MPELGLVFMPVLGFVFMPALGLDIIFVVGFETAGVEAELVGVACPTVVCLSTGLFVNGAAVVDWTPTKQKDSYQSV